MSIIDKKNSEVINNQEINNYFVTSKNADLELNCNILHTDFYMDSFNYFPITNDYFTFSEMFSWGDISKYKNFKTNDFFLNFNTNLDKFKTIEDAYILGSSSNDNYYRNIVTLLPRLFFIREKKIKLVLHRSSSNKFRNFIKKLCNDIGIKIQFIFIDNNFYKFVNCHIPQFFNLADSLDILKKLKSTEVSKREKIYLTRHNSTFRNLVNEGDFIDELKKNDFRIINLNDLSIFEQINIFSHAKVVLSATGSALANIAFCSPDTKIIEISPKYNFSYEEIFESRFRSMCKILKLNYFRIEADSINISDTDSEYKKFISSKVINESNYYKDLIIKMQDIKKIIDLAT